MKKRFEFPFNVARSPCGRARGCRWCRAVQSGASLQILSSGAGEDHLAGDGRTDVLRCAFFASNLTGRGFAAGGTVGAGIALYPRRIPVGPRVGGTNTPCRNSSTPGKARPIWELLKMVQPAGKERPPVFCGSKGHRGRAGRSTTGDLLLQWILRCRKGPDGWAIADGNLEPESLGFKIGGIRHGGVIR